MIYAALGAALIPRCLGFELLEGWSHDPCPSFCDTSSNDPGNWTTYHNLDFLARCSSPMMMDFAIFTDIANSHLSKTIRACTASELIFEVNTEAKAADLTRTIDVTLHAAWDSVSSERINDTSTFQVAEKMMAFYDISHSYQPSLFASHVGTVLAVHTGPGVEKDSMAKALLKELIKYLKKFNSEETIMLQVCEKGYTIGVVATTGPSRLATAQHVMQHWANGTCFSGYENKKIVKTISLLAPGTNLMNGQSYPSISTITPHLKVRGGCTTIKVQHGDLCGDLASRCGVSLKEFYKYNPGNSFCNTLQEGQKVCCSPGGLSVPTQNSDGSCATYKVNAGDQCSVIGPSHGITPSKIESYNKNTWGWTGCGDMQSGAVICLSEGTPPMPASVANAVCGPQVPGTLRPKKGTNLADLNPCPLNSCCSGAPGTAAPETNGCISNCGNHIVNDGSGPSTFRKIGYFEAFNVDRSSYRLAFNQFVKLKGVKRIISLGGWAFSTDPQTYNIFREAVKAENREIFANNVADFLKKWNLDGVDFDWEYPGEPDIKGIPKGSKQNGEEYSSFLAVLQKKISEHSISVAAPASYWYLKGYPVGKMDASIDYWVYMSYDLHGQWDFEKPWATPGCPLGSCLRSHVNLTETLDAISMITKAGVASNKIVVGLSNYGRSFQMTTPGCTGPMCQYTGEVSGAKPGRCTNTAGLLADAEIKEIIQKDSSAKTWVDKDSDSNILVYDSDQWVAFMDADIRKSRTNLYKGKNLGGVVEWAIDMEEFETTPTLPPTTTTTAPAVSVTATSPANIQGAINPYLYGCTNAQKKLVLQAWEEASVLAQGHYEWFPGSEWQDAMTLYIGSKSKDDLPGTTDEYETFKSLTLECLSIILTSFASGNVERQYKIHHGHFGDAPLNTYGYFYCDESKVPKNKKKNKKLPCSEPGTSAYTWDDPGKFWSAHYVVFCPQFFSSSMTSLAAAVEAADGDAVVQRTIDYWKPIRARALFHETYHWKDTVSVPRCLDWARYPSAITKLARVDQENAATNAESWTLAALSIFLQQVFHLDSPPAPMQAKSASDTLTIAGANLQELYLDAPRTGGSGLLTLPQKHSILPWMTQQCCQAWDH
ncbi:hypothetical protein N7450_001763 [Penicillium hetheringtonii]|uniref:chitinase n=1 Tax=Penicillium hetheringtonii TaxID=911720 RepID=A0AAD6E4R0_9EURO|nr:hypothetical protein N7450_001763 [Penicillium hetheringtonii]